MHKKKVLFVLESLTEGGAEKVLTTLIRNFDYERYDVTVCLVVDKSIYSDNIKDICKFCYVVPDSSNRSFLISLWCNLLYHLVFFWLPLSWVYGLFIPKGFDTEVAFIEGFVTKLMSHSKAQNKIAWVHCDLMEFPWPLNTGIYHSIEEEKSVYGKYDKITVVSQTSAQHFVEKYGLADRTCCIYNPIDTKEIAEKAAEGKRNYSNTFRFITVGRITEVKGFDRLVEAAAKLKSDGLQFEIWIVGNGEDRMSLEKQVGACGLDSMIYFLGFQPNPYQYLNQSDCFICSSRSEGYSLVIAEAMCCGLPVISTRCAGPEEILYGGKYGMIVENSTDGIYSGMKQVLEHRDMIAKMRELSCERAKVFDMQMTLADVRKMI